MANGHGGARPGAGRKKGSQLAADRTAGSVVMTDEERLEARRAAGRRYYAAHREEILAWQAENYRRNRERILARVKAYQARKKAEAENRVSARERIEPPRLALGPAEAAQSLGVSREFFDTHIAPDLKVVRLGRRILVDVRELQAWLERNSRSVL